MGVPESCSPLPLRVHIWHDTAALHWDRTFDGVNHMRSTFTPVSSYPDGYWVERTDRLSLNLGVEILDGGWYWRCRDVRFGGLRVPDWIGWVAKAHKRIVDGSYEFSVRIEHPALAHLFSYAGRLSPQVATKRRTTSSA